MINLCCSTSLDGKSIDHWAVNNLGSARQRSFKQDLRVRGKKLIIYIDGQYKQICFVTKNS